ncbi:MAG: BrnA antitoxin family protein [Pseudomonadales bacterium]|nr:BrnA antitoxin family protein [Pseudomonadales bacterium]
MNKNRTELTDLQKADLERLRNQSEDEIDTSDIPEILDWSNARRGMFYRPVKRQITLRLDVDVVAWFREHAGENGRGYQTEMNRALREHVVRAEREKAA